MPRKRNTAEQVITKLRQAEVEAARGQPIAEVCRSSAPVSRPTTVGVKNTAGYESTPQAAEST